MAITFAVAITKLLQITQWVLGTCWVNFTLDRISVAFNYGYGMRECC